MSYLSVFISNLSGSIPLCLLLMTITLATGPAQADYPPTRRTDHKDTYHRTEVADPYRWLEADVRESPEVNSWVESQSKFARAYLDPLPGRKVFAERLTRLYDYARYSPPAHKAGKYFYFKNDGLQNQAVLYVAKSPQEEGRVLLDPNSWSTDGTVALTAYAVSEDGELIAYATSASGSDWKSIRVMEVDSGKVRPDMVEWVRFSGIEWDHEGQGFYYSRYAEPSEDEKFQSVAQDQKLCYHRLGSSQADDPTIYERPDEPDWTFGISVTDDGAWLILSIHSGTDPQNQVWVRKASEASGKWQPVVDNFDHEYNFVADHKGQLYFLTDEGAPRKKLVAVGAADLGERREIIPERDATLVSADIVGGKLLAQYLRDVQADVEFFSLDGKSLGKVELPGLGTATGFGGKAEENETFYSFTNAITPTTIYRLDVASGKSDLLRKPAIDFDPARFEVKQVFYKSKDGTRVPMMISHRRGLELDGNNPTILYAYGGFNISITPAFSVDYAAWMEQGGVLAIPNLRGGGEYGEKWHVAGKKEKKQNVFDDFIAAAEWLIDNKYTSTKRLAIRGGSNGGLLVGACMTQRPELFGACLPAVGVHDMLRYHKFTAGQFWRTEYGSADENAEFPALLAYSPYHNVKTGVAYPPTMITTADTDDRVVPMHSFKFAAALQHAQTGQNPILLRVELKAGHGAGTPLSKQIDQTADAWAFLADLFKMKIEVQQ